MPTYRRDIDGLRAIAVLAVVFNHAGFPGFGGGFLGVDIFFVISGYLITGILIRSDGTLGQDILRFYERRVRRIVPALVVLLFACTVAAFIFMSPYELKEYAKSLLASVGFVVNLFFQQQTDYFAPKFEKPLLHLWSLAVEEQFYVVYPLFLWVVSRHARRLLLPALIAVFFLSLALSEWLAETHGGRIAFFFTGSRAWELTLGAIVAVLPDRLELPKPTVEITSAIALAMLAMPVWLFDLHTRWPGVHAMLPCAGTALLLGLHSRGRRSQINRILSATPLVAVGLISYSLYLWHWPLFEFYRRYVLRVPSPAEYAVLVGIATAAASLSWRFVEQPFRRSGTFRQEVLFGAAGLFSTLLLATGVAILAADGFPQRFPLPIRNIYAYLDVAAGPNFSREAGTCFVSGSDRKPFPFDRCFTLSPDHPNVVLWGDSHARNYAVGLREQARTAGINVMQLTFGSCLPLLAGTTGSTRCRTFNAAAIAHMDRRIDAVVLSGRFFAHQDKLPELADTARQLATRGFRVIVLGPSLEYPDPLPFYLARYAEKGDQTALDNARVDMPALIDFDRKMGKALSELTGVTYVSIVGTVCHEGHCPLTVRGAPIEFDTSHLSLEGSRLFAATLWPQIQTAITTQGHSGKLRQ